VKMSDGVATTHPGLTIVPPLVPDGAVRPPVEPIGVPPPSQPPPPKLSLLVTLPPDERKGKRLPELSASAAAVSGKRPSAFTPIPSVPSVQITLPKYPPPSLESVRPIDLNGEMLMAERLRHAEEANAMLENAVRALTALSGTLQPPSCSAKSVKTLSDLLRRAAFLSSSAVSLVNKTMRSSGVSSPTPSSARMQPPVSPKLAKPLSTQVFTSPNLPLVANPSSESESLRASGKWKSAPTFGEEDIAPPPAPPMLKTEPDSLSVTTATDRAESACTTSKISELFTKHHFQMTLQLSELVSDPINYNISLRGTNDSKNNQQEQLQQQKQIQHSGNSITNTRMLMSLL